MAIWPCGPGPLGGEVVSRIAKRRKLPKQDIPPATCVLLARGHADEKLLLGRSGQPRGKRVGTRVVASWGKFGAVAAPKGADACAHAEAQDPAAPGRLLQPPRLPAHRVPGRGVALPRDPRTARGGVDVPAHAPGGAGLGVVEPHALQHRRLAGHPPAPLPRGQDAAYRGSHGNMDSLCVQPHAGDVPRGARVRTGRGATRLHVLSPDTPPSPPRFRSVPSPRLCTPSRHSSYTLAPNLSRPLFILAARLRRV